VWRIRFELKVAAAGAAWLSPGWERIGLARSFDAGGNEQSVDNNFTATGAQSMSAEDLSARAHAPVP